MNNPRKFRYDLFFQSLKEQIIREVEFSKITPPLISYDTEFPRAFFLGALGNVLAEKNDWYLHTFEAIEYAIISKYSWTFEYVRSLPYRNKWLALHEECQKAKIPLDAIRVWKASEEAPQFVDYIQIWSYTFHSFYNELAFVKNAFDQGSEVST